jgi:hypothetical protein
MQSRAALVEDINRVRNAQDIKLEALGHGPSLEQQRAMALLAREHAHLARHDAHLGQGEAVARLDDFERETRCSRRPAPRGADLRGRMNATVAASPPVSGSGMPGASRRIAVTAALTRSASWSVA